MTEAVGGIACPMCGSSDHGVVDSRPACVAEQPTIRRRRRCRRCKHKWSTAEIGEGWLLDQPRIAHEAAVQEVISKLVKLIMHDQRERRDHAAR